MNVSRGFSAIAITIVDCGSVSIANRSRALAKSTRVRSSSELCAAHSCHSSATSSDERAAAGFASTASTAAGKSVPSSTPVMTANSIDPAIIARPAPKLSCTVRWGLALGSSGRASVAVK